MNKTLEQAAEDKSLEEEARSWGGSCAVDAFKGGVEWQKKQDELTWEDIKRIIQIADSMLTGTAWDAVDYPVEQKYYEEVLKQYKEEKK